MVRPNFGLVGLAGRSGAEHLAGVQVEALVDLDLPRSDVRRLRDRAAPNLLLKAEVPGLDVSARPRCRAATARHMQRGTVTWPELMSGTAIAGIPSSDRVAATYVERRG